MILFAPFRDDDRVKTVSDYTLIRSISPFALILQRSAAIIASQFVSGLAAMRKKKKKEVADRVSVRAYSHPGSDRNDLNAREAPEECRCEYAPHLPHDDLFALAPRREIRL